MTTSLTSTKRKKIVMKSSEVIPSNWHLETPQYAGKINLNGELQYTAWFDDEQDAKRCLKYLEIALDYHSYPTQQEEVSVEKNSRRAIKMREAYNKSGRTNGLYTGLAQEYVEIFNDDPK